ncbi:MAG: tetratricopeptide repeat protein [Armatimonadetes bacterium]|nr:tetratricopeptide repeat protein [Armatimonadota bacterium]
MKKFPHWTILSVAFGAFLLPLLGGKISLEAGRISPETSMLQAMLNGQDAPFLTHFFLSLFFFIPLTVTLFTHKISHVVNLRITFWLAMFGACLGASILVTSFPAVTILYVLEWAMMSLAFFAVTLCCGRKQSIIPILSLVAGITLAAISGILEYRDARVYDPGYRIFALQIGPNQAGAMLAAGTVLALVLALRYERLPRLALILAGTLQCFALVLTQSKGAILCLPLGIIAVLIGLLVLKPTKPGTAVAVLLIPLVLTGGMAMAAQKAATAQSGTTAISRLENTGGEAAQSAGFRKLLWVSAIDLTKQRPYGWGLGSFWYESTRPGLVTQTTLAHETFLQLASEASPVAAFSLVAFLGAVVVWGMRGIRKVSPDSQILLVGIFGALAVSVAHNLVDSDMYIFGLGSMVFLFCGAFTASSADSQAPEFIFTLPKVAYGIAAVVLIPLCLSVGIAETFRSRARDAMDHSDRQAMLDNANAALSITFADGEALSLRALANPNEADLVSAAQLHPSPKAYRALADYYLNQGKDQDCYRALDKALERDPNNASALLKYMEAAQKFGNIELATKEANALIATETTPYFTVRSQPEFIPTQTYDARLFLAKQSKSPAEKVKLLESAVMGFIQYRDTTGPVVARNLKAMPNGNFGGEDRDTLETHYRLAIEACKELETLQPTVGLNYQFDPRGEADKFAAALEALNK